MKTTRSRMLLVFLAAAFIVSVFMHWNEFAADVDRGFHDGMEDRVTYRSK